MRVNIGSWVCDQCDNIMEVTHVGPDENRIECPVCGNCFYVDDDGEYIND